MHFMDRRDDMNITRKDVEEEIGPVLQGKIKTCVDSNLISFKNKDYDVTTGDFGFNFIFSDEALLVNLDYPITLTKGNITEVQKNFVKDVKTNFWKEASLAASIVNIEARGDLVDLTQLSPNNLDFEISRGEVGGGNLYMLVPRSTNDTIFYFAIEK